MKMELFISASSFPTQPVLNQVLQGQISTDLNFSATSFLPGFDKPLYNPASHCMPNPNMPYHPHCDPLP